MQTDADTLPGWLALVLYLAPAAVALGLVVALFLRRRRLQGRPGYPGRGSEKGGEK